MDQRPVPNRAPAPARLTDWLLLAATLTGAATAAAAVEPIIARFSTASPGTDFPGQWRPLHFARIKRHTDYRLVEDAGTVVVRAEAHGSASGLVHNVHIDPRQYPLLQWRWKVANVLERADVHTRAGDDYPARLYVSFAYEPDRAGPLERAKFAALKLFYRRQPPGGALNYIWASHAPTGTRLANAYTDRVQMIVVESGRERLGRWVTETADLYEDFLQAFGHKPPAITGVAIMTDTDNTGESASALYGDIVFRRRE